MSYIELGELVALCIFIILVIIVFIIYRNKPKISFFLGLTAVVIVITTGIRSSGIKEENRKNKCLQTNKSQNCINFETWCKSNNLNYMEEYREKTGRHGVDRLFRYCNGVKESTYKSDTSNITGSILTLPRDIYKYNKMYRNQ